MTELFGTSEALTQRRKGAKEFLAPLRLCVGSLFLRLRVAADRLGRRLAGLARAARRRHCGRNRRPSSMEQHRKCALEGPDPRQ
jgi:hypothetical protein